MFDWIVSKITAHRVKLRARKMLRNGTNTVVPSKPLGVVSGSFSVAYPIVHYLDDGKDKRVYLDIDGAIKFIREQNLDREWLKNELDNCVNECCLDVSKNHVDWSCGYVLFEYSDVAQDFGAKDQIRHIRINASKEPYGIDLPEEQKHEIKLTYSNSKYLAKFGKPNN